MTQEYLIVIEKAERNDSAFSPDLPGCVATGADPDEVRTRMAEAIRLHIDGLARDGLPVPAPTAIAEIIPPAPADA